MSKALSLFLSLFVIILPSYLLADTVNVQTNHGAININFNEMDEKSKISIVAKILSDEVVQLAHHSASQKEFLKAYSYCMAAEHLNQKSYNAIFCVANYGAKDAIQKGHKDRAYNILINKAKELTAAGKMRMADKETWELSGNLYWEAEQISAFNSPNRQQAQANRQKVMAMLSRMSGNSMANRGNNAHFRQFADQDFMNSEFDKAIMSYANLYRNDPGMYPLKKISEAIKEVKKNGS